MEQMQEQKESRTCARLDAAYARLRAEPGDASYGALLTALAGDLADDAAVFIPVAAQHLGILQQGGPIKWSVLEVPRGRYLRIYTNADQVERHPACAASIRVKLSACFRMLSGPTRFAGIVLNADDGRHGVPVERGLLDQVRARVQAEAPRARQAALVQELVSEAYQRLFSVAAGVPAPVYDLAGDLKAAGGAAAVLDPVLGKWAAKLKDGSFRPTGPRDYLRTVVLDVMAKAFVAGVLVRRDPALIAGADTAQCLARVPDLKEHLEQNVEKYLLLLWDGAAHRLGEDQAEQVSALLSLHGRLVALGAMNFGFGWGLAKYVQMQTPDDLEAFAEEQRDFLARLGAAQ